MKRDIENELLTWKEEPDRYPLLIRGARQVGKTYVVEKFGKERFSDMISINFEKRPEAKQCFETLDPKEILSTIELFLKRTITPGKTLLFLDEIQECPRAIMALRYFKEEMPEMHVIGAGSLLEFALQHANFRMPVGRVQSLFLGPLSFLEFLRAGANPQLADELATIDLEHPLPSLIHEEALKLVQIYMALGGMPAVLASYFKHQSFHRCQDIQTTILITYRDDFGKYAKYTQHEHLQLLFERAPGLVAQWFKYVKVDPDIQSREIKAALSKLKQAGIIHQVYATRATGLPLITTANQRKFKLLFLDIGLMNRASLLDIPLFFRSDLMLVNQGAIAEQFVGQELLAYSSRKESGALFFWVREQKSSGAEVDYVTTIDSQIVPIEVKAGSTGRLRSLKRFIEEKKCALGVRISTHPLSLHDQMLSIPFYMIGQLNRLASGSILKW